MKFRTLLAVSAMGAACLVAGTGAARATAGTVLPFAFLEDIQVDDGHGRVFLSGSDGNLLMADLSGHLTSDPAISNVRRMAMAPDGNSLVVTRVSAGGDGQIAVLDAGTRAVTKTITLPAGCSVGDIAPASGKIFFYSFCNGTSSWKISAVDLATSVITWGLQTPDPGYVGQLYSVPGAPSMVVTWIEDKVIVYDTTGGLTPTATVRASRALGPYDVALSADGSQVVVSGSRAPNVQTYATADLAQVGEYAAGAQALAVRADGVVATAEPWVQKLSFFQPVTFDADQVRPLPYGASASAGSLAFGSKRLYEVLWIDGHLELLVDTPGPPAVLTIGPVATTYGYGASPSVKVGITSPTTNRSVNLYATPSYGGTKKFVKAVTIGPGLTVTTAMPVAYLNTTYTAEFEGDGDYAASSTTAAVKVRAKVSISTASTAKSSYFHKLPAEPIPKAVITVLPSRPIDGCLDVLVQRYTSSGWIVSQHRCFTRTSSTFKAGLVGTRGQKIRVRASLFKSNFHADSSSAWYYVLFT